MFHAIANITQLAIMDDEPLFQVGYPLVVHSEPHYSGDGAFHL